MAEALAIRQILFPTDFSDASEGARRTAVAFAHHFGARLHVLHVVPPATDPTPSSGWLLDLVGTLPGDLSVVSEKRSGLVPKQIVAYADGADIDLIVMGTHGRTGISHALLGSVAEAVIRRASCRVLTVPARVHDRDTSESAAEVESACLVCGTHSHDLICAECRARIRQGTSRSPSQTEARHQGR